MTQSKTSQTIDRNPMHTLIMKLNFSDPSFSFHHAFFLFFFFTLYKILFGVLLLTT